MFPYFSCNIILLQCVLIMVNLFPVICYGSFTYYLVKSYVANGMGMVCVTVMQEFLSAVCRM
jgi:hypothetical protein